VPTPLPIDPYSEDKDWAVIQEARRLAETRTEEERYLMQKRGKKIYVGHEGPEKHESWSGSLPFYLFWCEECEHWVKDYPHGYIERQYLRCHYCDAYHEFVPRSVKFRMLWKELKLLFRFALLRRGVISDKKVR